MNDFAAAERTMALTPHDLADAADQLARIQYPRTAPPRPPVPGSTARGTSKLPPLPPKPPQIKPRTTPPSVPATAPRKTQAIVRRPPVPTLPNRPFESPWEELATVYESLPAADASARLRWLFRASEVWETGAKDIARAFDALARAFAVARKPAPGAPTGTQTNDAEVRARLHRIASEHRAWDRLAELYEGMAEQAETAPAAADLLMEVANIRAEQRRPHDAEAQLRRILGMLPSDSTARGRIEELYRSEGRWVELAASLEERTDPRLGTAAPEAERPQLLRELAAIYTGKLQRGHDAIDAFERLRQLASADPQVLFQLADLYGGVGRWSKVIETLARVEEIAEGSPDARDAKRQIAKIYETELELPDRAIEAFEQIVSTWPDDEVAWAALDRLYQVQAKWSELADVLRRRAALARDPADRGHLLARRAGVLMDWLNSFEEAAAALRHARTVLPDDAALADQLVIALGRAGRHREAAATLEDRIDTLSRAGATSPRGELAALHIRLAQLRADHLDDRSGARASIDAALALVPEHPTALAVLAQLAAESEDPRAFADAKLREADSSTDADARIAALMAAGDVLHSRVGDVAAARGAYERALALRPYHAEATWALAGLVEKGGDPESAARLLESRLTDPALPAVEQAKLLTQLAALSRLAGVEPAAERRLLEALSAVPAHLPAIVALADFYADAERWDDVEAFLREQLEGPLLASAPPALVADLHRRLAHAHERLGRDDDAYQTLVAGDRLHRGHLLIKLALGENRYKARRWREAALHLSPLAHHDDAAHYPSEVAQGLYHAALAEIRSLRPEKAPALYARALELKPSYAPALQALAEIAMEQGDHVKAADLLTRQATATEDPAERLRLFEALGDMALVMLHDDARAVACYAAAVAAAQPIEARHLPLLTKLLERQQLAGDRDGSARTSELMAAFGATPTERATRHLQAARDYLFADEPQRARAAADRAVDADPYDVDACDLASELAIEAGDVEGAATILTRLLTASRTISAPADAERHATLSYRLGHARANRGDTRQALPALERAIQLAPDSDGATAARRILVELARDDAARKPTIAGHLQAIAAHTGDLDDLVAWAEELRRADVADHGRAALDLAIACGRDPELHQQAFLSQHEPYAMRDDEIYPAAIEAAERDAIIETLPEDLAPLQPIAMTLAEAATLLWPDLDAALARIGAAGARRVPSSQHVPAVAMFPRLTTVLGLGPAMVYQSVGPADGTPDVAVVCAATPVVVIGPRLATGGTLAPAVRAQLARAVELCRPEHIMFAGLPAEDVDRLIAAVVRLYGPPPLRDAVTARVVDQDVQRAHDEVVRAALPVRLRTRLEQQLQGVPSRALDAAAYLAASQRTADCMALRRRRRPARDRRGGARAR